MHSAGCSIRMSGMRRYRRREIRWSGLPGLSTSSSSGQSCRPELDATLDRSDGRQGGRAPDETTIRRFREALVRTGAVEKLFARFDAHLKDAGYLARISRHGRADHATIVAAPRQRMTDAGKEIVKGGGIPPDWQANPRKPAQKDRDARWTLKPGRRKTRPDGMAMGAIATPVFGCKSHINANRRHGFVRTWIVTDAARHDGHVAGGLPDQANTGSTATDSTVRADTAYRSQKNDKKIARAGLTPKVHFRRPPGKPMPVHHERANAAWSKVRSAIEHPFVGMKTRMGLFVRTIGIDRARARIGMANIAFNMKRLLFRERKGAVA